MTLREKSILIGLYLSKYDTAGLSALGFSTFKEAYNTLGLAIGAKATSLKNYRDELDPYFPNSRKGWHKRELRDHCKQIYDRHKDTDLDFLRHLICKLCGDDFRQITPFHEPHTAEGSESFAKRIMTGRAAENYFTKNYRKVPAFSDTELEDVTHSGCGYDFKLRANNSARFYAVEVKGIRELHGSIAMTEKEFQVASNLKDQFFLYVVKNFEDKPISVNVRNPIESPLNFTRTERQIVQVSWRSSL